MAPNTRGHSEATDSTPPTSEIAALSAQLQQLTATISSIRTEITATNTGMTALNTRIEAIEARSRPTTPVLPNAPITSPPAQQNTAPQTTTPQATQPANQGEDKRWRPEEVGYFDGSKDSDVIAFTDRLSSIATMKTVRLVQNNLVTVLKDTAFKWYHYEIDPHIKYAYNTSTSIDPWCQALIQRFGPSHAELIARLQVCQYTRKDAANKKDATAYIQEIMEITNGLKWSKQDGLMTAFDHFEPGLQQTLDPPEGGLTKFIKQVQLRQSGWYQMYSAFGKPRPPEYPNQSNRPPQQQHNQPNQPYQQYRQQPSQQYRQARPQQAYWGDEDDWVYDAPTDSYYATPGHPPGHTPRRLGNTHDNGGSEAMANWASVGEDHRCPHEGYTHYH